MLAKLQAQARRQKPHSGDDLEAEDASEVEVKTKKSRTKDDKMLPDVGPLHIVILPWLYLCCFDS